MSTLADRPLYGVVCMIAALVLLSTMDALVKTLTMQGVTVVQILALRSSIIVPALLIGFYASGKARELKPVSTRSHLARGLLGFIAPLCFFLGITHIPLTDAVVIFFSSTFIITILSSVVLGEKVGIHRWGSVVAGFVGVLIVVGPKGGGQIAGYLLVFAGSLGYALMFVSGRYLSATETVASLVISSNLCAGVISLILLPFFWTSLGSTMVLFVFFVAVFALGGHYLITTAFSRAEASLLAPFEYTSLIWAVMFDMLIWKVSPTLSTIVGAVIIIGSGLYIVHRERLRQENSEPESIM